MPDNADWDPADVRYNVIRWSDSFGSSVLGLGPSRVNPLTGEILDADVILDASVISYLNQQYDTYVAERSEEPGNALLQLCGHPLEAAYMGWMLGVDTSRPAIRSGGDSLAAATATVGSDGLLCRVSSYSTDCFRFIGPGYPGRSLRNETPPKPTYINDYLRALTAHEVGHVLGLRHNFLGSAMLSPEEINDPNITQTQGMLSSVMDYFPPHLAPPGATPGPVLSDPIRALRPVGD
jgi:hypothetical protein